MTESITVKNHNDRRHVIDITVVQQQPENLGPKGEFNIIERQDYRMINIDKLINDWLGEVM